MFLPGGVLTLLVIVVPLALALYISLLDLDQYSIRRVGRRRRSSGSTTTSRRSATRTWCTRSASASATRPWSRSAACRSGWPRRSPPRTGSRAAAWCARSCSSRTCCRPSWSAAPGGSSSSRTASPTGCSAPSGLWLNGPRSFWALVIVQLWAGWPLVYLLAAGRPAVGGRDRARGGRAGRRRLVGQAALRRAARSCAARSSLALVISFLHNVNSFTLPFVLFGVPSPLRRGGAAGADLCGELPELPSSGSASRWRWSR